MGLGYTQTLRLVVLPQALRKMTPAAHERLRRDAEGRRPDLDPRRSWMPCAPRRSRRRCTYNFTPYIVAALLFVLLAIPTIRLTDWYTARLRAREQMGSIV